MYTVSLDDEIQIQKSCCDVCFTNTAEVIHFEIPQNVKGKDLSECEFRVCFITPECETNCSLLHKNVIADKITLDWILPKCGKGKYHFKVVSIRKGTQHFTIGKQGYSKVKPASVWASGLRYINVIEN